MAAGDVFSPDFCFSWDDFIRFKESPDLAHLWLVANPDHNLKGDFGLVEGRATLLQDATPASQRYTFSTIALYRKAFFHSQWCDLPEGNPQGVKAALAPMLRQAISMGLVGASLYQGTWVDVGTPERLAQIGLMDCRA